MDRNFKWEIPTSDSRRRADFPNSSADLCFLPIVDKGVESGAEEISDWGFGGGGACSTSFASMIAPQNHLLCRIGSHMTFGLTGMSACSLRQDEDQPDNKNR